MLCWSRLDIMPAKRSNGGGPAVASRSFAEELYKEREQQQLGSVFHVVGSLRNWTSQWSDDVFPTPRVSDSTRVMCWNAGGGAGTLKDDDKLRFLTLVMLQQHIHVVCLTEGKVRS